MSSTLTDNELLCYTQYLRMIRADTEIRFRDLQNLEVPDWILEPFKVDVFEKETVIQEHPIDFQVMRRHKKALHIWLGCNVQWALHGQHLFCTVHPHYRRANCLLQGHPDLKRQT